MSKNFKGWSAEDVERIKKKNLVNEGDDAKNTSRQPANFFKKYALYIGIDGGTETGFAIWVPVEKRFIEVCTTNFWGAIDKLQALSFSYDKQHICVVIEDPKQNKSALHNIKKRKLPEFKNQEHRDNYMAKMGEGVGFVKRESVLLIEWLERNNWPHIAVKPTQSKNKDAAYFQSLTGWNKRCSQHGRDAAALVHGR